MSLQNSVVNSLSKIQFYEYFPLAEEMTGGRDENC